MVYCIYPYKNLKEYRENVDKDRLCDPDKCIKKEVNQGKMYWGWKWVPSERCAYSRRVSPYLGPKKTIRLINCVKQCLLCGVGMKRIYIQIYGYKPSWRTMKKTKTSKNKAVGYVCMGCGETVLTKEYYKLQQRYGIV